MTCSTNPAWLMFLTSVKWERSPQNADYLAPKCTQAYPAAEHEMKSLQMWFHLKGTMGRLPSYLGTKWLFIFIATWLICTRGPLVTMEARDPHQGRLISLTERSVSQFQLGRRRKGGGEEWGNRRRWQVTKWCRCLPTTGSANAHCRQVWSGLSRTWATENKPSL